MAEPTPEIETASFRPRILDAAQPEDRAALAALTSDPRYFVHDRIIDQLEELVASRQPGRPLTADERADLVQVELGGRAGRDVAEYGRWIDFGWSRRVVHLLPPDDFFALRTDRNRNKITGPEQAALRKKTVGVLGLSVGKQSAATLALEGVGGRFRLADFDTLSLSNMNRLRAGVHELGVPKVVVAAREVFELDPYLEVEIFPKGLDDETLPTFFENRGARLDLLVEECDDLAMKILAREKARGLAIPVVMETSDRGMIDVERFDLEPTRPLLHGLFGDLRAEDVRRMPMAEKLPIVLRILDENRISPKLAASIREIGRTVSTWPQLASAVALGGAVVTDVARRILLDELRASGRYYVDLERLVAPGSAI